MEYTLTHHGDEPCSTIAHVLQAYDGFPSPDDVDDEDADQLYDLVVQDDYLSQLIVIRETLYDQANAIDEDLEGSDVIDRELFRAAEWVSSAIDVYVAAMIVEVIGVAADATDVHPVIDGPASRN